MADEQIPFNLGIENAEVYGSLAEANAFLDETTVVTSDPEDIEDKNTPPKVKAKEKEKEKEEIKDPLELLTEDEEEETEEQEEEKEETSETPFESLGKELYSLGVFTTEEGEEPKDIKTAEELLETFNAEKTKGATTWLNNFLGRFGEDRQELFEAIFVNGVDPETYLPVYNQVQSVQTLDLEQESNQEKVLRVYYKKAGWPDEKIDSKIEKLKSYAELEDEAKTVHPLLVNAEKQELKNIEERDAAKQTELAEADAAYKEGLTKVLAEKTKLKEFDGIPLSEAEARKAFDFLYAKKWKLPSGELLTDFDKFILDSKRPENIADRIKIGLLAQNKFDFSKINKRAVSKEGNEIFSSLVKKSVKKPNTQPANNSWATV